MLMRYLLATGWFVLLVTATPAYSAEDAPIAEKPVAAASKDNPQEAIAGHSAHGDAFNEGPRQQAYLMNGVGHIHFPVTSSVPRVQEFFNQGVGQLHGFWYFEAERSFRQVATLDPKCAMAYWGMAMANVNNQTRARAFIAKAVELKAGASPREIQWIDALHAFHQAKPKGAKTSPNDDKDRRRAYIRALENIIHEFPDDLEAKAFLAITIWDSSSKGLPISSYQSVDALIGEVLAKEPMHSAHHYRIHLWDGEKPQRALGSAALCGQSAPGIAHMWHMPGHTYSKLKRYSDAAWQQEASARVDHAHMMRDRVLPDQIHNYAHNNQWLVEDLGYVGRVRDAIDLAKNMIELPRHPKYNDLQGKGSARQGRNRLFEILLRYELWDEILALSETMHLEPTEIHEEQIKRLKAVGIAKLGKGDIEGGRKQLVSLQEMLAKEKTEQEEAGEKAATAARERKESDDKVAKAKKDAISAKGSRLKPLETAIGEMEGHLAVAEGKFPAAFEAFNKVSYLQREVLSRAHFLAGDMAKAEQFAREAVNVAKNQVYPLANLVDILHRTGNAKESRKTFDDLRAISSAIDLSAPIFQRLKPIALEFDFPEDWRCAQSTPEDSGQRPPLESLGPFRWQPSPALTFSLPDTDGKPVSLAEYRGKPLVLIFYLGFGCVHCVEQLKTFGPMQKEFAEAGMSLVAVSTDPSDDLKKSLEFGKKGEDYPFTLLSDPEMNVFRLYRAYDDFEQEPLHGTFLIDGSGLVRWQDISFEPYMDAKFLLGEAKRLLPINSGALAK